MTSPIDIKKIEINLKRLISSCEKIIAEDDKVDVVNSEGEIRPVLIDNTFTVEKYIPIMLSMLKQLNEKMYEQNKLQQQSSSTTPQQQYNNNKATSFLPTTIATVSSNIIAAASSPSQYSSSPSTIASTNSPLTSNENTYIISKESISEYSRKIDVIVGLVNKEKLNSPISNKPNIVRLQASDISHSKKMDEIQTVMKTRNKEDKKRIEQLLPNNDSNNYSNNIVTAQQPTSPKLVNSSPINRNNNNNYNNNLSPALKYRNTFQNRNSELKNLLGNKAGFNDNLFNNEILDNDSFEKRTQEQRALQESLTSELLDYSKSLKNHSNTMSVKLSEEDKKLGELGQLVDTSTTKIQRQNENLKEYTKSSTSDTLNYCFIIVVVLVLFICTYLFMKLSTKEKPNFDY